jgi:hypothetical protein
MVLLRGENRAFVTLGTFPGRTTTKALSVGD